MRNTEQVEIIKKILDREIKQNNAIYITLIVLPQ